MLIDLKKISNTTRAIIMKNIFDPVYRHDYLEGYSCGLNPYAKPLNHQNAAYDFGFNQARDEYEKLNGKISYGIPQLIVTNKVLEDFLLAGMLGMSINSDGYNGYQIDIIQKWYLSGVEKYDVNQSIYLLAILEQKGIEIY
jgi:hypothetical protein